MTQLTGKLRAEYVKKMFTAIAGRYDRLNRLMTAGQDVRWRRAVIRQARLGPGERLLDLGAGTGDLAREALRQQPRAYVIAADFTPAMMRAGSRHGALPWCQADALALPYRTGSFAAVVSGFLFRNVIDLDQALGEACRVLSRGGRLVILDTTRPRRSLFSPMVRLHMHTIIPLLGRVLGGSNAAYRYLPESTEQFLSAEELASRMEGAGFSQVSFRVLMFGTVAIHYAEKPA